MDQSARTDTATAQTGITGDTGRSFTGWPCITVLPLLAMELQMKYDTLNMLAFVLPATIIVMVLAAAESVDAFTRIANLSPGNIVV